MSITEPIHELIYTSSLASSERIQAFGTIAQHARAANKRVDITGLLVFDGGQFCQCLEGDPEQLSILYQRIAADPRHTDVHIVHAGPIEARQFMQFTVGFFTGDDLDLFSDLKNTKPEDTHAFFQRMLPLIEMEFALPSDACSAALAPLPITRVKLCGAELPMTPGGRLIENLRRFFDVIDRCADMPPEGSQPSLEEVRRAVLYALESSGSERSIMSIVKINAAQTPDDLWALRADIHEVMSCARDQNDAIRRVDDLYLRDPLSPA